MVAVEAFAGVTVAWLGLRGALGSGAWIIAPAMWLGVMGILGLWAALINAHAEGLALLRRSGFRVCPGCEYDLSASDEAGKCPECGVAYDPVGLERRWREIYARLTNERPSRHD